MTGSQKVLKDKYLDNLGASKSLPSEKLLFPFPPTAITLNPVVSDAEISLCSPRCQKDPEDPRAVIKLSLLLKAQIQIHQVHFPPHCQDVQEVMRKYDQVWNWGQEMKEVASESRDRKDFMFFYGWQVSNTQMFTPSNTSIVSPPSHGTWSSKKSLSIEATRLFQWFHPLWSSKPIPCLGNCLAPPSRCWKVKVHSFMN